jgi:glycosyltransferase involved in cell wall biosynthesis
LDRLPAVSVIVPTYNRATFLEETIGSIFSQTIPVHEVLLVDDGSTDGTRDLVRELLSSHQGWRARLRYFWQENQGKSVALNLGLKFATGDWLAFNDSDDRWLPEKLELQFRALGDYPQAEACFTNVRFVNNPTMTETLFDLALPDRTSPFGIKHQASSLYGDTWPGIYMQSLLVSRTAMRLFGEFDPSMRISMDTDLAFRLSLLTAMCYVDRPLVDVDRTVERRIGLTTEHPMNGVDRLQVHERMITKWLAMTRRSHPHLGRQLRNRLSRSQSALANQYLLKEDYATARAVLGRAARQNPRAWVLAKFVWSVVGPRSLRREIIRRANSRSDRS